MNLTPPPKLTSTPSVGVAKVSAEGRDSRPSVELTGRPRSASVERLIAERDELLGDVTAMEERVEHLEGRLFEALGHCRRNHSKRTPAPASPPYRLPPVVIEEDDIKGACSLQ